MYKRDGQHTYSASDLVGFLECGHRTSLDLLDLESPLERAPADEQVELIQDKGFAHEAAYLERLRAAGGRMVELSSTGNPADNLAATHAAMADGADVIFQAALAEGVYIGYADFLRRVELPSALGAWSYEVADTKLAHRPKPKFMIQLTHYSALLAKALDGPVFRAFCVSASSVREGHGQSAKGSEGAPPGGLFSYNQSTPV